MHFIDGDDIPICTQFNSLIEGNIELLSEETEWSEKMKILSK